MKRILLIDNYDSFTYNLVHYIEALGDFKVDVKRNDDLNLEEVDQWDWIVISPGPGLPSETPLLVDIIQKYAANKRILGVCLGQQAIGEAFGGRLKQLDAVYHGVASEIRVSDVSEQLFENLPNDFEVGRYHSWVLDENNMPGDLKITATDKQGRVMAIRHKNYDVCAVQFHPESILTQHGKRIISNWLFG